MKNKFLIFLLLMIVVLGTGCTTTFMGTVLVLGFKDLIYYVIIAFILAILISMKSDTNPKGAFWLWFILSIILTPLAGFIYLIIEFTRK